MSEREETFALEALEATAPLEPQDADEASLAREYTELAGLLALEADDIAPRSEVKEAIFAAIRSSDAPSAPEAAGSDLPSNVVQMPVPASTTPAWTTWAAAAGLLLALSFAALSGFLFSRVQMQGQAIAQLEDEVLGLEQQRDLAGGEALDAGLARRVDLVTSSTAEVCALKPAGDSPAQPQARALFWADKESRRWVLSASQLERCPLGREYRIWFVGEDGTFNGGSFRVKGPDERIEIEADQMPPGTEKVLVTLEFPNKVGTEPGGELILYGDEARQIL
ncbi:MAG: anti-sigma factor [Acidobacteriota bacterium]